jgi:hypothetical protein
LTHNSHASHNSHRTADLITLRFANMGPQIPADLAAGTIRRAPDVLDDIAQIARDAILLANRRERALILAAIRIRAMRAELDELIARLEASHAKF